ncbi:MAG: glycosyltransferase N-terminal domain-containing protein, partial [Ginsengibacter sp.]
MIIFYHLFLFFYSAGIRVASLWNKKAKLWVNGRKNFFAKANELVKPKNSTRIWMHCASLGEFEQGRPVLKELKEIYPDVSVIITFFSPSGYEIVKKDTDFLD